VADFRQKRVCRRPECRGDGGRAAGKVVGGFDATDFGPQENAAAHRPSTLSNHSVPQTRQLDSDPQNASPRAGDSVHHEVHEGHEEENVRTDLRVLRGLRGSFPVLLPRSNAGLRCPEARSPKSEAWSWRLRRDPGRQARAVPVSGTAFARTHARTHARTQFATDCVSAC
jgi:hypothetical protein